MMTLSLKNNTVKQLHPELNKEHINTMESITRISVNTHLVHIIQIEVENAATYLRYPQLSITFAKLHNTSIVKITRRHAYEHCIQMFLFSIETLARTADRK